MREVVDMGRGTDAVEVAVVEEEMPTGELFVFWC